MRRWILFAALTAAGAFASPAVAGDECRLKQLASLDVQGDDVPIITASIGGKEAKLLVDTGAPYSMLTWRASQDLKLNLKLVPPAMFYLGNGSSMKYYSDVHDIAFGKLTADRFPVLIMPADWDLGDAEGVVGADILGSYDIELDFGARKINIMSPDHCRGQVVYWAQQPYVAIPMRIDADRHLHVKATVDGREMDALIDTGSSQTVLRIDEANAIAGKTLGSDDLIKPAAGSKDWAFYRFAVKSISIGGIVIQNPKVFVTSNQLPDVQEPYETHSDYRKVGLDAPPVVIGASILRRLHLYIAYKEGMLYATGANAH